MHPSVTSLLYCYFCDYATLAKEKPSAISYTASYPNGTAKTINVLINFTFILVQDNISS